MNNPVLNFSGKDENLGVSSYKPELVLANGAETDNKIFHGNNLAVMEYLLENGYENTIDLIYLDPPFFSNADYYHKVRVDGAVVALKAYGDKWLNGVTDYLQILFEQLKLMKRLLKDTGTIWVHTDRRVSHYIKVLMDEQSLFGMNNFVNEIIWTYTGGTDRTHGFPHKHDNILVYSKSADFKFNPIYVEFSESTLRRFNRIDEKGRKYKENKLADGRITRTYMKNKGKLCPDYWHFNIRVASHAESTGYATQKPMGLLKRIIESSTDAGDIVADFFMGSGTSLVCASELNRKFIGADIGRSSMNVTRKRLLGSNFSFTEHRKIQESVTFDCEISFRNEADSIVCDISGYSLLSVPECKVSDNKRRGIGEIINSLSISQLIDQINVYANCDKMKKLIDFSRLEHNNSSMLRLSIKRSMLSGCDSFDILLIDIFGNELFVNKDLGDLI